MFNEYNCKHKKEIRELLLGMLVRKFSSSYLFSSLTLPGEEFIMEQELIKRFDGLIVTCENNPKVFKQQQELARNLRVIHKFANINDLAFSKHYDFVWFDYCSQLNLPMVRDLQNIFKFNRVDKLQVIAVTIKGNREHSPVINLLAEAFGIRKTKNINKRIKEELYPKHLADLLGATNYIVKKYSRSKGSLMYTYIFEK